MQSVQNPAVRRAFYGRNRKVAFSGKAGIPCPSRGGMPYGGAVYSGADSGGKGKISWLQGGGIYQHHSCIKGGQRCVRHFLLCGADRPEHRCGGYPLYSRLQPGQLCPEPGTGKADSPAFRWMPGTCFRRAGGSGCGTGTASGCGDSGASGVPEGGHCRSGFCRCNLCHHGVCQAIGQGCIYHRHRDQHHGALTVCLPGQAVL